MTAFLLIACLAACHQTPPAGTTPPAGAPPVDPPIPAQVEGRIAEFVAADSTRLLLDKERTDWLVSAAWLPHEMRGSSFHAWFPLLAHSYTTADRQGWTAKDGPATSSQATEQAPWQARFSYCAWSCVGQDYPTFYSGRSGFDGTSLLLCLDWYEPFLSNRFIGFAMTPERIGLRWHGSGADVFRTDDGYTIGRRDFDKDDAIFNNPFFIYHPRDAMDALRSHWTLPAKADANSNATSYVQLQTEKEGEWHSGPAARTSKLAIDERRVTGLLELTPFVVKHSSPTPMSYEWAGKQVTVTPKRDETLLKGGRSVDVAIKNLDEPTVDIRIRYGDIPLGYAKVTDIVYGTAPLAELSDGGRAYIEIDQRLKALYAAIDDHDSAYAINDYRIEDCAVSDILLRRLRLKANIFNAVRTQSTDRLAQWVNQYEQMMLADGVPADFAIFNAEAVMRLCVEKGSDAFARYAISEVFERRVRSLSPQDKQIQLLRAIEGSRFDGAWLFANALASDEKASPKLRLWAAERRRDIEECKSCKQNDFPTDAVRAMDTLKLLDRIQAVSASHIPTEKVAP